MAGRATIEYPASGLEGFVVYTIVNCPHCDRAKRMLDDGGYPYVVVDCASPEEKRRLKDRLPEGTRLMVPQIWHGERHIGGASALEEYLRRFSNAKKGG